MAQRNQRRSGRALECAPRRAPEPDLSPTLVFDIETVPDVVALRRLRDLPAELPDAEVADAEFRTRREAGKPEFLPHHLHQVVAISCVLREGAHFRVWSLGEPGEPEGRLVHRFFEGIERFRPQLVSWNGNGFDLPVLHYRAMLHGVAAPTYWDQGEGDRDFKWNNYISRYHSRHLDLMDLLSLYQTRSAAPLDELARLFGQPGKLGMAGDQVWPAYLGGGLQRIRDYCETDVVNTWLVFLRFQRMRGILDAEGLTRERALVRETLAGMPGEHWRLFLQGWENA